MSAIFSDAKRISAVGLLVLAVGFSSYYYFGSTHKTVSAPPVTVTQTKSTVQAETTASTLEPSLAASLRASVRSVFATRNSVMTAPHVGDADKYTSRTFNQFSDEESYVNSLANRHVRWSTSGMHLLAIDLTGYQGVVAEATVLLSRDSVAVVDQQGAIEETVSAFGPTAVQITLVNDSGIWKLSSQTPVDLSAVQMSDLKSMGAR